jgi:hypothetical protein
MPSSFETRIRIPADLLARYLPAHSLKPGTVLEFGDRRMRCGQ